MRTLGINFSSTDAYLAVVQDGAVMDGRTERLRFPAALEAGEALVEFVDSVRRVLQEIQPNRLVVLLPETWQATYKQHLPRASVETLIRLTAAMEGIPVESLARATARSRLDLPRKGRLDSHIDAAGPVVGRYWRAGRALAVIAAMAGAASGA